jgi:hypothetical protein
MVKVQLGKETATPKLPVCQFSSISSVQSVSLAMANRGIPLCKGNLFLVIISGKEFLYIK